MINIDICICTFRRSHVVKTMQSIAAMETNTDWAIRLLIADNDDSPSARNIVEEAGRELDMNVVYIHAPARNISIARNACLEAARADLVAFIDDDELVSPHWLINMLKTLNNTGADAVMGPVNAVYGADAPIWIKAGGFHTTIPVMSDNRILTGGAGNVLMKIHSPSIEGKRFDTKLGKSGGEDSVFFAAIHQDGGHIAYAEDAIVTEEVPANRATFKWLFQRRFRYGQTHGSLLLHSGSVSILARGLAILVATSKSIFSFCMALLTVLSTGRCRYWLLRGGLHVGVISRLAGGRVIETYGGDNQS